MSALPHWLDQHSFFYPGLAGLSFLAATVFALRGLLRTKRGDDPPRTDWRWGVVIAVLLFAGRWPSVFVPLDLNSDESQLLAGAHTLTGDPIFWRSVDAGTAGPADVFALWPAGWLLGWDSYVTPRLTALAALTFAWLFLHQCVALRSGARFARVALLPAIAFEALTNGTDFLHYSSELVPLVLLAAAAFAATQRVRRPAPEIWNLLGGLALGAVPFAKLQAGPLAAAFGMAWLGTELFMPGPDRVRRVSRLVAGALLPGVVFLVPVLLAGELESFWFCYVHSNISYTAEQPLGPGGLLAEVWTRSYANDTLLHLWLPAILVWAAALFRWPFRPGRDARVFAAGTFLALLLGVLVVFAPGRPFLHYWQFVVLPASVLPAAFAGLTPDASRRTIYRTLAIGSTVIVLGLAGCRATHRNYFVGAFGYFQEHPRSALGEKLRALGRPGDKLAVWGICPRLFVESGLPQATREALVVHLVAPGPGQQYARERFLADFGVNRPALFVDVTGTDGMYYHSAPFAHDRNFPELAALVRADYVLVTTVDGGRIYLRRDLASR